jgi:hypothetical protein
MRSQRRAEIITVGTAEHPRYIIVEGAGASHGQRRYWAGQKWISQPRLALLYAHQEVASHDLDALSDDER